MQCDGIWNDLELQKRIENNVSKAWISAVFETIWNCRKKMRPYKQGRFIRVQYVTFLYDISTRRDTFESNEAIMVHSDAFWDLKL